MIMIFMKSFYHIKTDILYDNDFHILRIEVITFDKDVRQQHKLKPLSQLI